MKSVRISARSAAWLCVLAIAAGCAGTQTPIMPPAEGPIAAPLAQASAPSQAMTPNFAAAHANKTSHAKRKAALTIRIRIPNHRRGARGARYISASTKGMTIAFSGASAVNAAFALTPADPRCTGSPLKCTFVIDLSPGNYAASVNTYDLAPVSGAIPAGAKLLSTAHNVPLTVARGVSNALAVTLGGVPKSLSIGGFPTTGTAGTPFSHSFTVTAKDADGNVIVGSYATPVKFADADATGATAVATSGSDHPPASTLLSSIDTVKLNYTGLAIHAANVTATASGATGAQGTFTPTLNPIGPNSLTSFVYVNLYGTASPVAFNVSEVGFTNAPYHKTLTVTPSGCDGVATVASGNGSSFTVTLASGATTSGTCSVTFSDGLGQQLVVPIGYAAYGYTGSAQTFVVPDGVTLATVFAAGAQGGTGDATGYGSTSNPAGTGGLVSATITVTPSDSLQVNVGGKGGNGNVAGTSGGTGGWNGGGSGTYASVGGGWGGGAGGGATDVRAGGTTISPTDYRIIVAGGGGGAGATSDGGNGGNGGGTTGATGGTSATGCPAGGGGTPTAGGTSSACGVGPAGLSGTIGVGGASGSTTGAGGGGGGLYGGAGGSGYSGGYFPAGGGGGSSYTEPSATNVVNTQGGQVGNGYVTFTW